MDPLYFKGKQDQTFSDELIKASIDEVLNMNSWIERQHITHLCCVPSTNNRNLVPEFAKKIASQLNLPFVNCVIKTKDNKPQKTMENTFWQKRNLDGAFSVNVDEIPENSNFLLVDDIVDSRWTLTIIGALLKRPMLKGPSFLSSKSNNKELTVHISEVTKIILMLRLNLSQHHEYNSLKPNEIKSLFLFIESLGNPPESLLSNEMSNLTLLAQEKLGISSDRIKHLLSAGLSLSLRLEEWKRRGIWVKSYLDEDFPLILKIKHRKSYPLLIYGVGETKTLLKGGLGIVGSRNINSQDTIYSERAGIRCAEEGVMVISGGARGIDTLSMMACLNEGGERD